jgi:hypothetical protein
MRRLAEKLKALICKRQSLLHDMLQVAGMYDQPLAQSLANDAMREGRKVLSRYFPTEWLSRRWREPPEQSS